MRGAVLALFILAVVVALGILLISRARRRRAVARVEAETGWEACSEESEVDGSRAVVLRRVGCYKGRQWIIEREILTRVPDDDSQTLDLIDALGSAIAEAADRNVREGRTVCEPS